MARIAATLACVTITVSIAGCAGMSADECRLADWETIGYEDGVRGATGDAIAAHRKDCAKAGVSPDRNAYEFGRQQGLESYCQPANGFRTGSNGAGYRGVCPADMEPEFLHAYNEGRELHRLRGNVSHYASRINYERKELEDHREDLVEIEKQLVSEGLTASERVQLLADLKEASRKIGETEQKIQDLERDHAHAVAELRAFEEHSYSASLF